MLNDKYMMAKCKEMNKYEHDNYLILVAHEGSVINK